MKDLKRHQHKSDANMTFRFRSFGFIFNGVYRPNFVTKNRIFAGKNGFFVKKIKVLYTFKKIKIITNILKS